MAGATYSYAWLADLRYALCKHRQCIATSLTSAWLRVSYIRTVHALQLAHFLVRVGTTPLAALIHRSGKLESR